MFDSQSVVTPIRRAGAVLIGVAALTLSVAVTSSAHADPQPTTADKPETLAAGVVKLNDGEACPQATLCLYRDYGRQGAAYGIGAGYHVDLSQLPMGTGTAADNVSSWVNKTPNVAILIDSSNGLVRPLAPGQSLEEPPNNNDTADQVGWLV